MKQILNNFQAISGQHCVTTALRHLFLHHGHPLSEEMLFGLSSGLGFWYGDFKVFVAPMVSFRIGVGEFEKNLAARLNVKLPIERTSSAKKAHECLKAALLRNQPVMLYVDMAFLRYLNLPPDAHFGGHSIVVFGIDEEAGVAYVSDRDGKDHRMTLNADEIPEDVHLVPLDELANARGSAYKPFPPKNAWVTLDADGFVSPNAATIAAAIYKNAHAMLNPPIKSLGVKGIHTFANSVLNWTAFADDKLKLAAFNGFIMIDQAGGTGGGGFRRMYGNFLLECGRLLSADALLSAGEAYLHVSGGWDEIGRLLFQIFTTQDRALLRQISSQIFVLYDKEIGVLQQLLRWSESAQ